MIYSIIKTMLCFIMLICLQNTMRGQSSEMVFQVENGKITLRKIADFDLDERERKYGAGIRTDNSGNYSISSAEGGIKVWNTSTGKYKFCVGESGKTYNQIVLSNNGKFLAGYRGKRIFIWETGDCRLLKSLEVSKDLNNRGLAISSNGKYLFYAFDYSNTPNSREKVSLWDIEDGADKIDLQPERLPIYKSGYDPYYDRDTLRLASADFSPDSKIIAVQYAYRIYLWDVETGKVIHRMVDGTLNKQSVEKKISQGGIYHIKFSNDGSLLASWAADGTVKVWDVQTAELKQTFRIKDKVHGQTLFSKDNKYIATGGSKGEISLWETASGKMLWKGGKKNFTPLFSSPEVGLLSVESGDIYDLITGKILKEIKGEFFDDGSLIMKDSDGNLSVWKVERR